MTVLAAQRLAQVIQILLQLLVIRLQVVSLRGKGTGQYTKQPKRRRWRHLVGCTFSCSKSSSALPTLICSANSFFRRTYTYYQEKNAAGKKIKKPYFSSHVSFHEQEHVIDVRGFTLAFTCRVPSFSSSRSHKDCLFCSSSLTFLWSFRSTGSSSEG